MAHKIGFAIVLIVIVAASLADIFNKHPLKAAETRSAKVAYSINNIMVYCEEHNGNEIYVATYGSTSGAGVSMFVVPGGCK